MNKPTLYVLIGPAGSGKTDFAKTLDHVMPVSTDQIRKMLYGSEECQENSAEVFRRAYETIRRRLRNGIDVAFDATNTTSKTRNELLKRLADISCTTIAVYMNTPLGECKRRNQQRERIVPDAVIERQYAQMIRDAASIPVRFDEIMIVEGWKK